MRVKVNTEVPSTQTTSTFCHIVPPDGGKAAIVSLTHVRVPRSMPLAAEVLRYQKHRVKKLRQQGKG